MMMICPGDKASGERDRGMDYPGAHLYVVPVMVEHCDSSDLAVPFRSKIYSLHVSGFIIALQILAQYTEMSSGYSGPCPSHD